MGADGVTRAVQMSEEITETQSVMVELNTQFQARSQRYTSVEIILVNGCQLFKPSAVGEGAACQALPGNWDNPSGFDPTEENLGNGQGDIGIWHVGRGVQGDSKGVDAFAFTVGYDEVKQAAGEEAPTLSEFGCVKTKTECVRDCTGPDGCQDVCTVLEDSVKPVVWMGVRCAWDSETRPCYFDLEYNLLPRHISDGDAIHATIAAAETHYYVAHLGPFDVLTLELARRGDNLTRVVLDVDGQPTGERVSNGHGITAWLLAARDRCPRREEAECKGQNCAHSWPAEMVVMGTAPPPAPLYKVEVVDSVDEEAGPFELSFFCTAEEEQGYYAFAVAATETLGPIGIDFANTGAGGCEDGYVGADGITQLPTGFGPPQCNPNSVTNELKPNVGRYTLTLTHKQFEEGLLARHEVRPGCVSYGQWRRFTVASTNTRDANVYVQLSVPVSALLLRAGAPPTLETHDGMIGPEGTALALSPCDLTAPPVWRVRWSKGAPTPLLTPERRLGSADLGGGLGSAPQAAPDPAAVAPSTARHVAYYLAEDAQQAGLAPAELELTVQLQDSQVCTRCARCTLSALRTLCTLRHRWRRAARSRRARTAAMASSAAAR